ncbi:hypothetical protein pCM2_0011 (plasmid) [Clavibacter michiganensis subsp. michiganensis NCPPB 382]|uniref:Uncharacterized protein n=1 Tax=Clavibacter michiganensis subsp. michiganensis (strain NCPPB 382) TaxID=443906 RepID=A5CLM2_CLAM3|nr:hypothetical protein pCM2_0011 [Clavibacter michiganensis subsp. michiganensis NCPPB 382]
MSQRCARSVTAGDPSGAASRCAPCPPRGLRPSTALTPPPTPLRSVSASVPGHLCSFLSSLVPRSSIHSQICHTSGITNE